MKTFLLMKSNLRKNKSSSITLVILILLPVALLYSSMMVLFDLDRVVDRINKENKGADYLTIVPEGLTSTIKEKLSRLENYEFCEAEEAVSGYGTIQNTRVEKTAQNIELIFLNETYNRKISQVNIIDAADTRTKDSILIPYSLKATYHYQTGDQIDIKINGKNKTYTIYGFIQDVLFSTAMNIEDYIVYVSDEQFHTIQNEAPENTRKSYIKIRLKEGADIAQFDSQFIKEILTSKGIEPVSILNLDYKNMKNGTTVMIKIIAMLLIAFAFLIIFISLVVIRFTIINDIEEDIKNIGSMEAAGFTSKMIRTALVFQFFLLSVIGFTAGIIIALSASRFFTKMVSSTIGMCWNAEFSFPSFLLTFFIVFLFVSFISLKVSARLKRITPIIALRNGLSTYSFKKNYFPLEHTSGNLHLILGLKQMFHARKQNVSICLIGMIMSFTIIASFTIYNNFTGEDSKMTSMVGLEKSNIAITCASKEDCRKTIEQLKKYSEIRKVTRVDYRDVILKYGCTEISTSAQICEDFSELEVSTLSEGRYPRHDNEIALSYLNAKKLNIGLGDVLTLEGKDGNYDYIVVGFTQHINHLGSSCSLTAEGMLRSDQGYYENMIYIYTNKGVNVSTFLKTLEDELGHESLSYINMDESFANTLQSVRMVCEVFCSVLVIVAVIVIAIILFYLVKVKVTRDKVLLGIQKAVGFTTKQLMLQNVVSFGLSLFLSYVIGGVLVIVFSTPLCTLMFSVCDFKKCTLNLSSLTIVISIVLLTLFTMAVTAAVSLRIRKIHVRQLFLD